MKSSTRRYISHAFIVNHFVHYPGSIDTVNITDFPKRSYDVPGPRELKCACEMYALVNEFVYRVCIV